jgi:hypothetical protein
MRYFLQNELQAILSVSIRGGPQVTGDVNLRFGSVKRVVDSSTTSFESQNKPFSQGIR